jgi:hypothetical protein
MKNPGKHANFVEHITNLERKIVLHLEKLAIIAINRTTSDQCAYRDESR